MEEQKQTFNYKRNRFLSDSSDEEGEEGQKYDSPNETPEPLPDQSNNTTPRSEQLDALDDYSAQIMQLFPNEKLKVQKHTKIREILSTAINYFNSNQRTPKPKNDFSKEAEKLKEKCESQNSIIKHMENTVIESKKENKMLNNKIEKLQDTINKLEFTNTQQSLSADVVSMLKDNHKRLEEDNKYLKEAYDEIK